MLGFAGKAGHGLCGNRWKYPQLYPQRGCRDDRSVWMPLPALCLPDKTGMAQTALLADAWNGTR